MVDGLNSAQPYALQSEGDERFVHQQNHSGLGLGIQGWFRHRLNVKC